MFFLPQTLQNDASDIPWRSQNVFKTLPRLLKTRAVLLRMFSNSMGWGFGEELRIWAKAGDLRRSWGERERSGFGGEWDENRELLIRPLFQISTSSQHSLTKKNTNVSFVFYLFLCNLYPLCNHCAIVFLM